MLDLIVDFCPWDWMLWTIREKMKFVFNHTRVTNRGVWSYIFPTSVRLLAEKTKSSKKERRLTIWILNWNWNLNWNWSANCNTSDQGVISHSRANKKETYVYLWSLKQPSALLFALLEKMMYSMANFFLAALLCSLFGSFVCLSKVQSDFSDAGRRQIRFFLKRSVLLSRHDKSIYRIPNVCELFLKELAYLVVIFSEKPKW